MDKKRLIKSISSITAVVTIFLASIYFMLFTDLYLSSDSAKLFAGIGLGFGSGVFLVLGDYFRHKKPLYLTFKGIAIACCGGLVGYLFAYLTFPIYTDTRTFLKLFKQMQDGRVVFFLDKVNFKNAYSIEFTKDGWFIANIVIAIVSLVAQIVNYVVNIVFGVEE